MPDLHGPRQPGNRPSPAEIDAIVRRRLLLALDASNAGAWEWHFEHPSLRAAGFARLLGIADDDHVNVKDWLSAVHPDDADDFEQSMHDALTSEGPWQYRHRIVAADGVVRWLDIRADPLRINDEVVGMVGICIDVTEQQEQLRRDTETMQLMNEVVDAVPQLSKAHDDTHLIALTCELARSIFGADGAHWWDLDTEQARLRQAAPRDHFTTHAALPVRAMLDGLVPADPSTGAFFLSAPDIAATNARLPGAPHAYVAMPMTIGGQVTAYIGLSWEAPRERPFPQWYTVLERFTTNVTQALLSARRQQASDEANALARRLQSGLLPSRALHGNGPLRVQTVYHPAESQLMLGGDFLDVFWHDSGTISFILGDVCGHGPEQAALGTILRSAWMGLVASEVDEPARWTTILNDVLLARRDDDSTFVTLVTGCIDPRSNTITYVLAGHPPPFLIVPADGDANAVRADELPRASTLALGIAERVEARTTVLELPPEFGVLAVTDGLYEGLSASGERLGYEGLRDLVHDFPTHRTHALEDFVRTVEQLSGGRLSDDTAALLISRGHRLGRTVR